jgi:hypothetical protein
MLWLDEHPNLATSLGEAFTLYKLEKGEKWLNTNTILLG